MSSREHPRYHAGGYLTVEQRRDRLAERLAEVVLWRDRATVDIDTWTFDGERLALGASWPDRDGVHVLEATDVVVPVAWPVDEVRVDLGLGGEGLLSLIGPDGIADRFGLDPYHFRFPVQGSRFGLSVDIVARKPFGEPNRDPRLDRARVVWQDDVVDEFARKLDLILESAGALADEEVVGALLSCAEQALAVVDWPSATGDYVARSAPSQTLQDIWALPPDLDPAPPGLDDVQRLSVERASHLLSTQLAALQERYPRRGELLLTGLAHLDLAWLWPLAETRRKALRTSWTVLNLMTRYPEFTYNQSSAQLYEFIAEDDPELFQQIEKVVASGQWEPIGGMWVEVDGNLPCGESFVRQLLYGQNAFERMFGAIHRVGWLPDSFGFSPGLPQLFLSAGIDSLFTQKLNRSDTNQFPHDLYWWEGIDGSRMLVHGFDNPNGSYDAILGPEAMVRTWENSRGKALHPESLLSIGYGDGGGGPTAEMVEKSRLMGDFPALPRATFGRVDEAFERMHRTAESSTLPVWNGELYLEFHRGTYTTQGRLKWMHRRAERDLVAAETLGALCGLLTGERPSSLSKEWQTLLLNQFHDILPGSSIREVNVEAEEQLGDVTLSAGRRAASHFATLGRLVAVPGDRPGLLVANPELGERPVRAVVDGPLENGQVVEGGVCVAAPDQTVDGLEAKVIVDLTPRAGLSASTRHLENAYVRIDIDSTGAFSRIFDKTAGREVLTGRGNQLWAYVDKPRLYDAWEIDESYADVGMELVDVDSIELVEEGPHRAAVRVTRTFRSSTIVQDLRLWANSPRVEIHTTIEWHDRRWLLKARFPLAVKAPHATFETAFGVVQRPTHRNSSWDAAKYEVPAHRFVDLSEPGYGVALLNDGKYGHHADGSELGISLLRSPIYPDPLADEGRHEFTYALFAHDGDWFSGGVLAEAEDLNRPLFATTVQVSGPASLRPLRLTGLPLGLGVLKASENGDSYVLRCYEPHGARGTASVEVPDGWSLDSELDVLERPHGPADLSFAPFQVRTWRIAPSA